jgi:hypothetical protein
VIDMDWLIAGAALTLAAVFGATPGWTRHTSPTSATRVLLVLSSVVALASAATLIVLALPLFGRSDVFADQGHWSEAVFARGSASGLAVSVLTTIALAASVVRVARERRAQMRDLAAANRFRHDVGAAEGETIVATLDEVDAVALSSGVIVITPGLIRALDADERRAVLAHERAHLQHRHHRYRRIAALLAAANPLLRRVPDAVSYLTERWADEDAAAATSRATTAAALTGVARLTGERVERSLATIHSATVGVPERVLALESAPPRLPWHRLLWPAVLVTGLVAIALIASERTLDLFQLARALANVARTH